MIPNLHYISQGETTEQHLENILKACTHGADLVQLRLKNEDEITLLKTAERAREITKKFQTKLIINDHYKIAKAVEADGVHLGKTDACPTLARQHLYDWQIIGGTANNLQDCQELMDKKVDYIGLGPFRFTSTKKNLSSILGLEGYVSLLNEWNSETPIIAIGGITIKDLPELLKTGIYGVAVSGAITKDFESIKAFQKILRTPVDQV
ncbi:thiamine phosphate synthase [Aequorivita xiaoshiensis]|uniref:Thiamine-phosphate synthase n=1 Tax=Aequorivita xiaoshiensis TaxID=2874476 RepID=A0A9X1R405_9FLAO|nr:thiamine phosphate synthase [Aequorivita xiaoshiensis]MCG2431831.1 thiamine phosphate synthase [Aequorivita xiaoshiensis]